MATRPLLRQCPKVSAVKEESSSCDQSVSHCAIVISSYWRHNFNLRINRSQLINFSRRRRNSISPFAKEIDCDGWRGPARTGGVWHGMATLDGRIGRQSAFGELPIVFNVSGNESARREQTNSCMIDEVVAGMKKRDGNGWLTLEGVVLGSNWVVTDQCRDVLQWWRSAPLRAMICGLARNVQIFAKKCYSKKMSHKCKQTHQRDSLHHFIKLHRDRDSRS